MEKASIKLTFLITLLVIVSCGASFSKVPRVEAGAVVVQKTCTGVADCIVPCPKGPSHCFNGVCKCWPGDQAVVVQKTCTGVADCIVPCPKGPSHCFNGVCKCGPGDQQYSTLD